MKKKLTIAAAGALIIIATILLILHLRKDRPVEKSKIEQAADSARKYRTKVINDSINLVIGKDKLKQYETEFDTLVKDQSNDSFAMQIKRSVLRARVNRDIRAAAVRDSLRGLGTSARSH